MSQKLKSVAYQKDAKPKKKPTYQKVDIQELEKGKILLPGRNLCDCMVTRHKLINNCLACGRVVCEQEGEGPCFFCGNPVYKAGNPLGGQDFMTIEDAQIIDASKQKALEHKNKLLAYDKNKVQGSNIIDDETDWYEITDNVWLEQKQRDYALAKMKEEDAKREEDDKGIKLAFDINTNQFVEGKSTYDASKGIEEAHAFMNEVTKAKPRVGTGASANLSNEQAETHSRLSEMIRATYQAQAKATSEKDKKKDDKAQEDQSLQPKSKRVQHEDIFEDFKAALQQKTTQGHDNTRDLYDEQIFPIESENGSCLSMHQPWASLVVYGFKRFEGRMWTSRYRGPLWIQAGSKVPTQEEIKMVEDQYKRLYKDVKDLPPFPERYPTGSLLGIVDLEDIVRVEDYSRYIDEAKREETACKYLFVCRNPRKLLYPIKMPGEKQIFKIDSMDLREKARKNLMKVPTNWYPYYANDLRGKERVPDEELELDAMRLEYSREEIGLFVNGFLRDQDGAKLAQTIMTLLQKDGSKYIGKQFMKTAKVSDLGEVGQKLKKYIPLIAQKKLKLERLEYDDRMDQVDFLMLSEKDKEVSVDPKYSLMIILGRSVKFGYEVYKKKTVVLSNGQIVMLNEGGQTVLTVQNIEKIEKDSDEAKSVSSITENSALLIFI